MKYSMGYLKLMPTPLGLAVLPHIPTDHNLTVFVMKGDADASVSEDSIFVRKALGLDPTEEEFSLDSAV